MWGMKVHEGRQKRPWPMMRMADWRSVEEPKGRKSKTGMQYYDKKTDLMSLFAAFFCKMLNFNVILP